MKKLTIILVAILSIFSFSNNVMAIECKYKYDKNKEIIINTSKDENGNITMTYNEEELKQKYKYDTVRNFLDVSVLASEDKCFKSLYVYNLTADDAFIKWLAFGITVVSGIAAAAVVMDLSTKIQKGSHLAIFGSSLDSVTIDDIEANEFDLNDYGFWSKTYFANKHMKSYQAKYVGDLSNDNLVGSCNLVFTMNTEIANAYAEYNECGPIIEGVSNATKSKIGVCKSKALTKVQEATDELTETCNKILQNQALDVDDGCVDGCLNSINTVKSLKDYYIGEEDYSSTCGFSSNLIGWIRNILNIIKYILPVLVIVLGIIDFIRALSSDKDDEMKKAQGRFVKRLISAALAFIIPFIIVFILEKFGFVVDGCGVIDLGL